VILQSLPQLLAARGVAAVVILSLFASALFSLLALAERVALPWVYRAGEERLP
jgi:putative hydroxymethylpyrimidine transport system permease protein